VIARRAPFKAWARRNARDRALADVATPLLRCALVESLPMNPTRHPAARSASRAAWSLALGIGGVAAKRASGFGPAPI